MNRVGSGGKGLDYAGDSQGLDFHGDPLLNAGDANGVFKATLSAADLATYRARFPADLDADAFVLR